MQALGDHVSAGAVVELSAGKQRHSEKNAGDKSSADDRLRRDLPGKGGNPAEGDHEQDTDQRAQEGENKGRNRQGKREGGDTLKTPGMLLHAEHARNIVGGKIAITVAASGVPNRAEKAALIPAITMIRRALSWK